MHQFLSLRIIFALFVFGTSTASATGHKVDCSMNQISKRGISYTFKGVSPSLQPQVVEAVYKPADSFYLTRFRNAPAQTPDDGIDSIEVGLPVYNATSAFTLPDDITLNVKPSFNKLLREDPMRFRFIVRKMAERIERESLDTDGDGDIDIFDVALAESSTSSEAAKSTTEPPLLPAISSILNDIRTRSTATNEAEAYATSVLERLVSNALESNHPAQTTSASLAGNANAKYTYEERMTSYGPTLGVKAFATSYLVVMRVSSTTASGATCTTGQGVIRATPTCGGAKSGVTGPAVMALFGVIAQAILSY